MICIDFIISWYDIANFGPKTLVVLFFGLFPQKTSYQLDVIHTYILISLPISNLCGTL